MARTTIAHRQTHQDRGSAMIMTLMVMALVTALATTVSVLTINNLQSSWRAQQAGSALNAADAGVAQGMSYLRNTGVRQIACSPTCAANPWGNQASPTSVSLPGKSGEAYKAWIEVVRGYPTHNPGLYRIHSTGTAAGTASRGVVVDVAVSTEQLPIGVYARSISGGGSATVTRQSVVSTGCVYRRDLIDMVPGELDAAYGIPIGVHSSQYITESNGTGQYCPATDNKLIHKDGPCNAEYPYDQDRLGGNLASTPCASVQTTYPAYYGPKDFDSDGTFDVRGSYIDSDAALRKLFRVPDPALTQRQVDQLRTVAQSQDNYWTSATGWSSPDEDNAVMFFSLTGAAAGGTIDLNDITGFGRDPNLAETSPSCPSKSLVVVIEGGNAKLNSNQKLFASLFLTSSAPHGQVTKANGTSNFIGTIYADTVNLVGNADISLDKCFLANVSPGLLDLEVMKYLEDDRGLS